MTGMKLSLISVFDKKTSVYGQPLAFQYIADSIRDFDDLKKDPNTKFGKHPEDFELYKVGEFDMDNGEMIPHKPIQLG